MTPSAMRELQLAQDHALQVDDVLHGLGGRHHHAGELDLAHAQRAALAGRAEPAEEEAGQLPQRVEAQAARHDGIALEVAGEEPIQRGLPATLSSATIWPLPCAPPVSEMLEMRSNMSMGGSGSWALPAAEQLAAAAGQQILVFVARRALGHCHGRPIPHRAYRRMHGRLSHLPAASRRFLSHSRIAQKPAFYPRAAADHPGEPSSDAPPLRASAGRRYTVI